MSSVNLRSGPGDLRFLTWVPRTGESGVQEQWRRAAQDTAALLDAEEAVLLHCRVYGSLDAADAALSAGGDLPIPPTFVEGRSCSGGSLAGMHAMAAAPAPSGAVRTIRFGGETAGRAVRGAGAEYLYLSDVSRFVPPHRKASREQEAGAALEAAADLLGANGWSIHDVLRTWFYLRDILDWYPAFNESRNRVFHRMGLFDPERKERLPASTGIEGRGRRQDACTLDLLAVRPLPDAPFSIRRLANPKQNEAPQYGSSFSRGLSVSAGRGGHLFVSGTASIDEEGRSVYPGEFVRQVEHTLSAVESLLREGGATLEDVVQGTAFVKRPEDAEALRACIAGSGLKRVPLVCTLADVCRDDLLFEFDATACPGWNAG